MRTGRIGRYAAVCVAVGLLAMGQAWGAEGGLPETVPVGNPDNASDSTGYGAVAYEYKIGKYEVTNAEYCEFLNAVAKTDAYQLYDPRMDGWPENWGGITQSGSYGEHTYAVREGMGKKPVNYVTFESCVRFVNWLSNGRGEGDTETGSYTIEYGTVKVPDHAALAAEKAVKWVLPSENEWYKAAYYDPDKSGDAGYWLYPAKSDSEPAANLNSNAPSDVGSYSASAYGTFDQGGNVWEYNDAQNGAKIGLRGGSFYINDHEGYMRSTARYNVYGAKWPNYGFRVVALGGSESK